MLKVILNRLKPQAEEIITEGQAWFRAERSITEEFRVKSSSDIGRICTMSPLISKRPLTKYSMDRVVLQKSSPAGGAIFFAHRGLSQTSAQASSATAKLPSANPPRSHRKTTQLPVEIAEGSISIAAGAYRTAGDVSMIDSLKIFRIHVSCFPSGMYERQIL